MTSEPGHLARYYHQAAAETLRLIPTDAQRVLDLGCADGSFGITVKDRTGAELWGIVSDEHTTRPASAVIDRVLTEDLERQIAQLPDGYFDAVICVDVLERLVERARRYGSCAPSSSPMASSSPRFRTSAFFPRWARCCSEKTSARGLWPFRPHLNTLLYPPEHRANLQEGGLADTADRGNQRLARPAGRGDRRRQLGFFAAGRYLHYVCVGSPAAPRPRLLSVFKAVARQVS
ncbi:methionine biosynthesis protein MetW [Mycobacterium ostraviense]|uniref:methionine biosynthesis protein MetW n=1 Tax=Mycobacterium ostraviense TaxID=2738409 RepID=UPI000AF0DC04|nr:class I SAM-dependent methyltransferase [Mycobacterium ostraviense]UGT93973.1 class I SAM-dependent methyltransferase [Mycobacterium ostraviense]